jgi:hypothetical protein
LGKEKAMDSVSNWLFDQPMVDMAGPAPGDNALCWKYENGIHSMIIDAPEGTKGSTKYKVKGLSPYFWDFDEKNNNDEGSSGKCYDVFKKDTSNFDVDTLLENILETKEDILIDDWKNWGADQTIIVSTHGTTFGYDSAAQTKWKPSYDTARGQNNFKDPTICLLTHVLADTTFIITQRSDSLGNIFYDTAKSPPYWKDLTAQPSPRIVLYPMPGMRMVEYPVPKAIIDTFPRYALSPSFFKDYDKNMDSSLVYISACRSLYNNGLWNSFHANGVKSMLGYTDFVKLAFAAQMGQTIFKSLANGDTLKHAMDSARVFAGNNWHKCKRKPSDSVEWPADSMDCRKAARFEYRGDSNFTYFHPPYLFNFSNDLVSLDTNGWYAHFEDVSSYNNPIMNSDSVSVPGNKYILLRQKLDSAFFFVQAVDHPEDFNSAAMLHIHSMAPVYANAIYLTANTWGVVDSLIINHNEAARITCYFTKKGGVVESWMDILFEGINIRPTYIDPDSPANAPTDSNTINIRTDIIAPWPDVPESKVKSFIDLIKIPIPDSYKDCKIDSIKVQNTVGHCGEGSGTWPGILYLNAMTIEQVHPKPIK